MRAFVLLAAVVVSGMALADGDEGLVEEKAYNSWHFRVGPVLSPRVRVEMRGSRFALPAMPEANSRSGGTGGNLPAGPSAGYVERRYADGYVRPDRGTEDPDSIISGLTWDWGAADVPAQYANGRMEFHTDVTRWSEQSSVSTFRRGSDSESDRNLLIGVEAIGGWTFWNNRTFDAAVDAGFRFYGSGYQDAESKYGTTVTTTRDKYRFVDSYDASGWTEVPQGAHKGTAGGPGRVIGALPTRREERMGTDSTTETYLQSGDTRLIYRIWDLRFGPTFGWQATDWFALRGGVYGLLGLVDATLKTDGNAAGGASASTCGAVFGMAFGLSAQVNLTDNLFLMGGVEYDWWTDSVDLNAGGTDAEIKLSDMSISLGIGVEF